MMHQRQCASRRAGAGKWADLVSPRCVTAVLPAMHVELLATVSHARLRCLFHPCRWFQAPTDPRATMKALAFSRQAPGERCGVITPSCRELSHAHPTRDGQSGHSKLPFPSATRGGRRKHRKTGRMIAPEKANESCKNEPATHMNESCHTYE